MSLADMDGYRAGLEAIGASLRNALSACRAKSRAEERAKKARREWDAADARRRANTLGNILGRPFTEWANARDDPQAPHGPAPTNT